MRVLIADDQPLARTGLRKIFEGDPQLEIVAEAVDGLAAVEMVSRFAPDVVVMDIRMPRLDGIEATRRIVEEHASRVLVLTTFDLDEYVFESLRAGASGFMLKDAPPEDLIGAVHTIARGEALLAPAITRAVIERFLELPTPDPSLLDSLDDLTEREREVLDLLGRGRSNQEIAASLFLSDGTVKTHVHRVLSKLDLRDRAQAVVFAYESGLIEPGAAR
jgi:DNA-binding NarL/FixJ family response regulator